MNSELTNNKFKVGDFVMKVGDLSRTKHRVCYWYHNGQQWHYVIKKANDLGCGKVDQAFFGRVLPENELMEYRENLTKCISCGEINFIVVVAGNTSWSATGIGTMTKNGDHTQIDQIFCSRCNKSYRYEDFKWQKEDSHTY